MPRHLGGRGFFWLDALVSRAVGAHKCFFRTNPARALPQAGLKDAVGVQPHGAFLALFTDSLPGGLFNQLTIIKELD
jgi:hypothetical protein